MRNQKKIMFSGSDASHQMGQKSTPSGQSLLLTMDRTMLIHYALRCPKENFSQIFYQWVWAVLYGSKIRSLICNLFYLIFRYGQYLGLRQCHKPQVIVMFGVFEIFFGSKF